MEDGALGSSSTTQITLPLLQPPSDGLIALLRAPAMARLHDPVEMSLTVRNRHPTRSATVMVQVDCELTDGFVLAGLRSGRLPVLLPGGEHSMTWNLIPIDCGFVRLPRITVIDRRKTFVPAQQQVPPVPEAEMPGQVVKLVDVRWDVRGADDAVAALVRRESSDSSDSDDGGERPEVGTVLVLPS